MKIRFSVNNHILSKKSLKEKEKLRKTSRFW